MKINVSPIRPCRHLPRDGAALGLKKLTFRSKMLGSVIWKLKPIQIQRLRLELLFRFQGYSLPFRPEQQLRNPKLIQIPNTHITLPATEGSGVTSVAPRRITL